MTWRELERFSDARVPKLDNLRRAARAGLRVPPTVWSYARDVRAGEASRPGIVRDAPLIVRSASPNEDGLDSTSAGRYLSVALHEPGEAAFREALERVLAALRADGSGAHAAAVFVQPLLAPERGGVAFFDGFYYERTTAAGGNQELTAGRARGEVVRGHLARGEAWSRWLERVGGVFGEVLDAGRALDVEFAEHEGVYTLLQARAAPFELLRNPTLSLANHREILGELPSPWMVAALERAGADALEFFAEVDPAVRAWREPYAVALGGRAWLNVSVFYRLMDRWGLPRTFVTEGIGGAQEAPEDGRFAFGRMLRASPRLILLQLKNLVTAARAGRGLAALDDALANARTLEDLFDATAQGLALALRTNFAINGALAGIVRVRRALGLRGSADVVTERMMAEYEALRGVPAGELEPRLDRWLAEYGHRGPLESDLARPRFFELRGLLLEELAASASAPKGDAAPADRRGGRGPLFAMDRRREWFRSELMKRWVRLRDALRRRAQQRVADGDLGQLDDVFFLVREDLGRGRGMARVARERRAERELLRSAQLPDSADRETLEALLARGAETHPGTPVARAGTFEGIALSRATFEGEVLRADDLVELLERSASGEAVLRPTTVLLVPALEPSWAVVFPRVGAVVTEIGGELSHASILLREAGIPAIVNCRGAWDGLKDGDLVRIDGAAGTLVALEASGAQGHAGTG